jgi:ankyrin repeat protein
MIMGGESDVNFENPKALGSTPLFVAARNGFVELADLLIEAGANINFARQDDGITPLYIAANNGYKDMVKLLLRNDADPNKRRTDIGASPLCIAARYLIE